MSFWTLNHEHLIGEKCFIIAEIGQNHQGNLETAKNMIKVAKECNVDCVKFQKSDLKEKFTQSALAKPYKSINSFGDTYGEHKNSLEFTIEDYKKLIECAKMNNILLSASAMDHVSYNQLKELKLPFIKIGSGDNNNWIMMEKIKSDVNIPIILSTGMLDKEGIMKIKELLGDKSNLAVLHCVSSYPTKPQDVNLRYIKVFKDLFPNCVIGYSGHESTSIAITLGAVALGAKVIERHFTLDKTLKGSDHSCSLNPLELKNLVHLVRVLENKEIKSHDTEDIINVVKDVIVETGNLHLLHELDDFRIALNEVKLDHKTVLDCERPCYDKLRKTLVYSQNLKSGHIMQKDDFSIKVNYVFGIKTENMYKIIGKKLQKDVKYEDLVQYDHFETI